MKKITLIALLFMLSSCATDIYEELEKNNSYSGMVKESTRTIVSPLIFTAWLLGGMDGSIETSETKNKRLKANLNRKIFFKHICQRKQVVSIDLTNKHAFIGKEQPNLSHYRKIDEYDSFLEKISLDKTKYLCIDKKPNSLFPNGCKSILKEDIKPVSGIWYLDRILKYGETSYLEFYQTLANGSTLKATTEYDNVEHLLTNADNIDKQEWQGNNYRTPYICTY